jgi:hypothetical protein
MKGYERVDVYRSTFSRLALVGVNFMPWPIYSLDRRLGGLQNQSEHCGKEKILDPRGT